MTESTVFFLFSGCNKMQEFIWYVLFIPPLLPSHGWLCKLTEKTNCKMQVHSTRLSHKMTFNPSKDKTKHTEKPDNNNNNSSYFSKAKNMYITWRIHSCTRKMLIRN